jgi:hypothetical protein
MPMKSKLPNDGELSVKYILKELDPSEELLVEQAMMEDDNTLIEIESLRTTYHKLQSLPLLNAPGEVLDNILAHSELQRMNAGKIRSLANFRTISYAAAASLMIASGATWYLQTGGTNTMMVSDDTTSSVYETKPYSSPWVDKKDIMHVESIGSGTEILTDSVQNKLRPIDVEVTNVRTNRQVQLTGAQN